jgi:hypothetical protein
MANQPKPTSGDSSHNKEVHDHMVAKEHDNEVAMKMAFAAGVGLGLVAAAGLVLTWLMKH